MTTTPGIDFENLNLRDALDLAVLIEEEARDRYVELAGQLVLHQSPEAAAFFEKMAKAEEIHRGKLLAERTRLYADAPVQMRREMFEEIEAPRGFDPRVRMTIQEALGEALKAEERAQEFFERILIRVRNPEVGRLFAELREEEVEHRRLVLAEIAASPAPHRRSRGSGREQPPG